MSARYLKDEIARLRGRHPSYLYHEYLAEVNAPLLFSQFVSQAENHGLQFLAEADLRLLFPSTYGERIGELLEPMEDLIAQGQYLDFLLNRNFRQSLLCRSEIPLSRELDLGQFDRLAFHADLLPPKTLELRRVKAQRFRAAAGGEEYEVSHPLTKAALAWLSTRYPSSLNLETLQQEARTMVAQNGDPALAEQPEHLFGELFSLIVYQAVGLTTAPHEVDNRPAPHPRASSLARTQAAAGLGHVATLHHGTLQLDPFATRLLHYLDGSLDLAGLGAALAAELESGQLSLPALANKQGEALRRQIERNIERLLHLFARQGILEND